MSHFQLKKKGAPRMMSATETVMANAKNDSSEITTESRLQLETLELNTDLASIEESNTVSNVPSSFSPKNA